MNEQPSLGSPPADPKASPTRPDQAVSDTRKLVHVLASPLPEIEFQTDVSGRWTRLSPAWTRVMGHDVPPLLGTPVLDCVHPQDRARKALPMYPPAYCGRECVCAGNEGCWRYEIRFIASDGSVRWMEVYAHAVQDDRGMFAGSAGKLIDITQRRHIAERLRLAASVFDGTSDGIVITDPQGHIVDVNLAFTTLTGYCRDEVLGRTPAILCSGCHGKDFYQAMWDSLAKTGHWSGEIWNRRANGELVAEMLRISAVHSPCGEHTHYVGIFSDITRLKRQQQDLERLTYYDALTGVPNRALALDRLGQLTAGAHREGQQVAVCYLDLDGFGDVSSKIGHAHGDALLAAVAQRLTHAVRTSDTVARVGGDEFLLLLGGINDTGTVQATLERVLASLAQPFSQAVALPPMTASVGVALYPKHGSMPEQLLRAADQAMYCAKRLGKNRTCMAGDEAVRSPAQAALLEQLRAALDNDQLILHYQPKVCTRTRVAVGAEALVRWQHPRHGLLAPGAFLPAVAGTPLELELDWWVVRTAVEQLARWRKAGRTLQLSINVSPGTLVQPHMADTVAGIMRGAGQPLDGIELEVLETAALEDLEAASRAIEACARHGIAFALDDFGTGYSSLNYLSRLPVSTLKIDRGFVSNMLVNRRDLHIVRAVIGLAEAFGVATVAEGVETPEHARMLAELGCRQLQGYGIAQPMPAHALEVWLDEFKYELFVPEVTAASTPCC